MVHIDQNRSFYERESRGALIQPLRQTEQKHSTWFADSLPPLVRREGKGVGSADNPPTIAIVGDKSRHSFGSFYATIVWLALRTTPNAKAADAALEAWYRAQLAPVAAN